MHLLSSKYRMCIAFESQSQEIRIIGRYFVWRMRLFWEMNKVVQWKTTVFSLKILLAVGFPIGKLSSRTSLKCELDHSIIWENFDRSKHASVPDTWHKCIHLYKEWKHRLALGRYESSLSSPLASLLHIQPLDWTALDWDKLVPSVYIGMVEEIKKLHSAFLIAGLHGYEIPGLSEYRP